MIEDRYKVSAARVDNGEVITGNYIRYEHMGRVRHFVCMNWAQVYVNSYEVKPETVKPVKAMVVKYQIGVGADDFYWKCPNCNNEVLDGCYCGTCGMALEWPIHKK